MDRPTDLAELVVSLGGPDPAGSAAHIVDLCIPGALAEGDRLVALCWATVDLERTIADAALPFVAASRDGLLGGTVASVHIGGLDVLVEEPDTEGRLAAFLARNGEGICAVYIERPADAGRPVSRPVSRPRSTPLGRDGSLLAHEWPWGPFVVIMG